MSKLKKHLFPGNIPCPFPPHTLSVCMIVKNEESSLPICLSSIKDLADEIIIVDTGSTDRTREIAKTHGAKVIASDWQDDFSYSRNISIRHATSEWILWLDADDCLEPPSLAQILRLKRELENPVTVFGFKVKNVMDTGLGDVFMQIRMFPNDKRLRFEWPIHEQIILSADKNGYKPIYLPEVEIRHSGYHDNETKKKKALRNRVILEKGLDRYSKYPSYVAAYGDSFSMTDEWEKAIEIYKSVLEIKDCRKKHSDIYEFMFVTIALGYKHLGRTKETLEWVDKGLIVKPDKLELLFLGGDVSFDTGDMDRAFQYYTKAVSAPEVLATTPVDHAALKSKSLMRLSKIHSARKEYEMARACLNSIDKINRNFFDVPASQGETYLEEGKFLDAFKAFSDSIMRFPGADARAYLGLAEICARSGREEEAVSFFEKGLSFFPEDITLLEGFKNFLREKGDMERYLDCSRRLSEVAARSGKSE